jgi:hypothetical protein
MRPILCAALALAFLLPCETRAQQPAGSNLFGIEPGAYSVGFRLLDEQDRSRIVTGGIGSTAQPRPMRIYLWYPAKKSAPPMRFGRYAALSEEDIWPASLRDKLGYSRRPLARSLGPAGFAALLERPVLAVENAAPVDGPFPLIVIGQGFWIEPAISLAALGEYLAGRGFVVATAPLVGTNSPVVKVDAQDLESEVRDLEFAIARSRQLSFVSPDKLGVIGLDMGGMAGLLLAMRNREVDAFVSLPAGILFEHPSGLPRTLPGYDPRALRIPWLHITPANGATPPPGSQASSLFETAKYSERYLLLTPNLGHVDLTIDGLIQGRSPMPGPAYSQETPTGSEGQRAFTPYVFNFLAAFLARDAASRADGLAFLSRAPEESGWKMTLEHRRAVPASLTHEEFVATVVAGRGDEAIRRLRSVVADEPDHALLNESYLWRLNANLLFTWGLGKEAIPVIDFMMERYPDSGAQVLLAEAHILTGNYEAAIELYSKFLERYPNNTIAQSRLAWLRSH